MTIFEEVGKNSTVINSVFWLKDYDSNKMKFQERYKIFQPNVENEKTTFCVGD
jgi:hypothetical protein